MRNILPSNTVVVMLCTGSPDYLKHVLLIQGLIEGKTWWMLPLWCHIYQDIWLKAHGLARPGGCCRCGVKSMRV
jgi:hypothetical protein